MPKDKHQLLKDLKLRKKNRHLKEVHEVLEAFEFEMRKASKENSIWKKGSVTLTLPLPHGGDKVLKPSYISLVIREIERSEVLDEIKEGEESNE